MENLKRYKRKFDEYDYADKKVHIIGVSLDNNSKRIYLLGFKNERNADEAKDYFENVSDISVFSVDNFGHSTMEKAEDYFSQYSTVVEFSITNTDRALKSNPEALVNQVYKSLKK